MPGTLPGTHIRTIATSYPGVPGVPGVPGYILRLVENLKKETSRSRFRIFYLMLGLVWAPRALIEIDRDLSLITTT